MATVEDVFVGQLMTSDVETITLDATVRDVARRMRTSDINALVVTETDGSLVGIVTSTDVLDCVASGRDVDAESVDECLTRDVAVVRAGDPVETAVAVFRELDVHHVPVVDESNTVIGILSTTDVASYAKHGFAASV